MRKSLLSRVVKSELPTEGSFRNKTLREKFARSYDAMYPNLLDARVKNRRNITFELRDAISGLLSALYNHAPNVTGYGMRFGILYNIINKYEAEVIIGGSFAPYMTHLAYPVGPYGTYKYAGWVDDALDEFYSNGVPDNVEVSYPDIEYGETVINIYVEED